MLVLSRKLNQEILLGDDIKITVLKVKGNTVRLGIEAPRSVHVIRGELADEAGEAQSSTETRVEEPTMAEFTVVFSNEAEAKSEQVSVPFPQSKSVQKGLSLAKPIRGTDKQNTDATPDSIQFRERLPMSLQHNRLQEIVKQLTNKQ